MKLLVKYLSVGVYAFSFIACYANNSFHYWAQTTQKNLAIIKSTITACVSPLLETKENQEWINQGINLAMQKVKLHPSYYGSMFAL